MQATCHRCGVGFTLHEFQRVARRICPDGPMPCRDCRDADVEVSDMVHELWVAALSVGILGSTARALGITNGSASLDGYEIPPGRAIYWRVACDWECPQGLYLHGDPGVGKSHLAYGIVERWSRERIDLSYRGNWVIDVPDRIADHVEEMARVEHPDGVSVLVKDVVACSVETLLGRIKSRYGEGGDGEAVVNMLERCDLVVLDDLGAERPTEWAQEQLFRIIDRRVAADRPIIVTSNYSPAQLARRYHGRDDAMPGKRLLSRLQGACRIVHLEGPDYRTAHVKENRCRE